MNVVVFTPTVRPGLDVSLASIRRQTIRPQWWIGDELLEQRRPTLQRATDIEWSTFNPREHTTRPFTIATAYRVALELCRTFRDVDLLVTLEDYTWIPPDGIERFIAMAQQHPRSLLGGIVNGSKDPDPSLVVNPEDPYSIFAEPYEDEPQILDWEDCRLDRGREGYQRVESQRWEPPYAAIPRALLEDHRLVPDVRYDRGMTHWNQAFSELAERLGYDVWLDLENRAWHLPHRQYFPEQNERFSQANNHEFHEQMRREHA